MIFDPGDQPRRSRPESEALYRAVLALRRAGHRVYRAGRDISLVDGKRTTNELVIASAQQSEGEP